MLKKFKFENFLSYLEEQIFDLTAQPVKEHREYLHTANDYDAELRLLKSAGVYGHNTHGKSNFIKAYHAFLKMVVLNKIEIEHFCGPGRAGKKGAEEATKFEIEFVLGEIKYRYLCAIFQREVIREELYYAAPKVRENYLFLRSWQAFTVSKNWQKISSHTKLNIAIDFTPPNQLLLSILLAQDNIPHIDVIARWLKGNIIIPDDFGEMHEDRAMMISFHKDYQDLLSTFLKYADLGLQPLVEKLQCPDCVEKCLDGDLLQMFREKNKPPVESCPKHNDLRKFWDIETWKKESSGTYRYFMLSCYLVFAIKNKQLVFVDELDSRLHAYLLQFLVRIFNDPNVNKEGSQMIFTTHNTTLLSNQLFRRDQFLIVEKNEKDGTSSLRKMHTSDAPIRSDSSLEKEYIRGKIGGISRKLRELVAFTH